MPGKQQLMLSDSSHESVFQKHPDFSSPVRRLRRLTLLRKPCRKMAIRNVQTQAAGNVTSTASPKQAPMHRACIT